LPILMETSKHFEGYSAKPIIIDYNRDTALNAYKMTSAIKQ